MNKDKYVFAQLVGFLDNFKFLRIVKKYEGNSDGEEIDIKQKFDEDEDIVDATNPEFEEDHVMTSMDGYTLDEGGEEGNMFDDSLADVEEDSYTSDDFSDDFGSDDM